MSEEQLNEITETVARNLTAEERAAKVVELKEYEDSIKNGIANPGSIIHEMVFSTEKVIFQRWAHTLKQMHYLGTYPDPLNTISTYIKKQIGRMGIDLAKKENLYRNVERSIDSEFKEERADRPNVGENTSAFFKVADGFLYKQLVIFRDYHLEFARIVNVMLKHFERPEYGTLIYNDFEAVIEWREIALFCATLESLMEPVIKLQDQTKDLDKALEDDSLANYTTLKHILENTNFRQSADTLRRCMLILKGDDLFRQMAHKLAISPRQNRRVRERMEHWPKKDVKAVIKKVLQTFKCSNCGFDIITGRKQLDLTDDKFIVWKFSDAGLRPDLKIPKGIKLEYDDKIRGKNPIQIAEIVFSKKRKIIPF